MKHFSLLALSAASCLAVFPAFASEQAPKIENAYSYATAASQKNGAAFMEISLPEGAQSDRLTAVSAENLAASIELHTHIMEGDVMQMRKVEGGFALEASQTLELKPGGDHIMFLGLEAPLSEGAHIPLTLHFEKAGEIALEVPVLAAGTKPATEQADDGHDAHEGHDAHTHDDHKDESHDESGHSHH